MQLGILGEGTATRLLSLDGKVEIIRTDLGLDNSMPGGAVIDSAISQLRLESETRGMSNTEIADRVLMEIRGKLSVAKAPSSVPAEPEDTKFVVVED